jgi:hypothetical protein
MLRVALTLMAAVVATSVTAADPVEALVAKNPVAEAEKAHASGNSRHIVLPVCGEQRGEVIPGWPANDTPEVQKAIDLGQRPLSCTDFGYDPRNVRFLRAARWAAQYNRRLLELGARKR